MNLYYHQGLEFDCDISVANIKAADNYLKAFRQTLAQYDLTRHEIKVARYHSQTVLLVNGEPWFALRAGTPVTDAIIAIGAILDEAPWASQLDGVVL